MNFKLFLLATFLAFGSAHAALRAVATTPDVAWLLKRVGGSEVSVTALLKSSQNYHFADARPDYILAVARADVLCRVGADMEIGWLPKVLEKAGNAKVKQGAAGDCDLSRAVELGDKPTGQVSRAMGDAHAAGNPHYWLSPLEMISAAQEVEAKLAAADPAHAALFKTNREQTQSELKALHQEIKAKLAPLAGRKTYEYHKHFHYFFKAYGLNSLGSIEEVPGVPPSAARLGAVSLEAKKHGAVLALASEQDPKSTLEKFHEISGIPVIAVPTSLANPENANAYKDWQETIAAKLLVTRTAP